MTLREVKTCGDCFWFLKSFCHEDKPKVLYLGNEGVTSARPFVNKEDHCCRKFQDPNYVMDCFIGYVGKYS